MDGSAETQRPDLRVAAPVVAVARRRLDLLAGVAASIDLAHHSRHEEVEAHVPAILDAYPHGRRPRRDPEQQLGLDDRAILRSDPDRAARSDVLATRRA